MQLNLTDGQPNSYGRSADWFARRAACPASAGHAPAWRRRPQSADRYSGYHRRAGCRYASSNALVRAAQSVKLLGAQLVLTGIRPEVAQTLVGLGTNLTDIITRSSLQSGIAFAAERG